MEISPKKITLLGHSTQKRFWWLCGWLICSVTPCCLGFTEPTLGLGGGIPKIIYLPSPFNLIYLWYFLWSFEYFHVKIRLKNTDWRFHVFSSVTKRLQMLKWLVLRSDLQIWPQSQYSFCCSASLWKPGSAWNMCAFWEELVFYFPSPSELHVQCRFAIKNLGRKVNLWNIFICSLGQ